MTDLAKHVNKPGRDKLVKQVRAKINELGAVISAFIVQIWFQDSILSIIISISMVLTMIIAGLFGILVPVTLKKMNIDPAIASSVFVTTITDVIGFVSFLGVGAYFL